MSSNTRSRYFAPKSLPTPAVASRRRSSAGNGIPARSNSASSSTSSPSFSPTMQVAGEDGLEQSILGLSLESSPPLHARTLSPSPLSYQNGAPALTAPLPTSSSLQEDAASVRLSDASLEAKIKFVRETLFLVDRMCAPSTTASADPQIGPIVITDSSLRQLADSSVELLLSLIPSLPSPGTKLSPPIAEALYLRASLTASGAFPAHLQENPRVAFRAFEASARAGHYAAWFKLGRIYEAFDESRRAKECFERGAKMDDTSCLYRLGMAHLMGQLKLPVSSPKAVSLLFRAAERASIAVPQPAYVYASLLLGDFAHTCATLPSSIFLPYITSGSTIEREAQRFLERAAYLHFAPAQYKLGHFYEFARAPYGYDPLLSVQYYTLASNFGEPEASLALSKWFLCGAEGAFEKDEQLAYALAERAARAGLPSAEFAMGYYWEVGIGTSADMHRARRWYEMASAHGNSDAADRITSLAQTLTRSFSRQDHDTLAEQSLVRRRTQAKQRSEAAGSLRRGSSREDALQVIELVRRASKIQPRSAPRARSSAEAGSIGASDSTGSSRSNSERLSEINEPPRRRHAETMPIPSLAPRFSEKKRYSLVDPGPSSHAVSPQRVDARTGAGSQAPPRRYASPSPARTSRSGSEVTSSTPSTSLESPMPSPGLGVMPVASAPRVRYKTFAEMGIQSQKLEEKECIIM